MPMHMVMLMWPAWQVLEIDPIKRTLLTFGVVGESERSERECAGSKHCGEDKWIGGVLAANGKIFGIPYAAESVLEIDPATRTASTFGVVCASASASKSQPSRVPLPVPHTRSDALPLTAHTLVSVAQVVLSQA
jgi:hypothetical protein